MSSSVDCCINQMSTTTAQLLYLDDERDKCFHSEIDAYLAKCSLLYVKLSIVVYR